MGVPDLKLLVTGANGFVGSALLLRLALDTQYQVMAALRCSVSDMPKGITPVQVSDLRPEAGWQPAVTGVNAVVHTAGRAHVMREAASDPLAEFRMVNVKGTLNLARQAAAAGVRRFIFLSSVKVNGETTGSRAKRKVARVENGRAGFSENDVPDPQDPYSVSKWEAEKGLMDLAAETGMEVVIIRLPLVYGPGVKANFLNMMRWLYRGVPLPLGSIHNRRSLVAIDNLVDFICVCLNHPAAANQTFLVSDGEDMSTTELLRRMADALHVPARLVPVPQDLLEWGARMLGRENLSQRLCGSLQVDISKARTLLGWRPPVTIETALRRTAEHFLNSRKSDG